MLEEVASSRSGHPLLNSLVARNFFIPRPCTGTAHPCLHSIAHVRVETSRSNGLWREKQLFWPLKLLSPTTQSIILRSGLWGQVPFKMAAADR
jgi:hypothetical protein